MGWLYELFINSGCDAEAASWVTAIVGGLFLFFLMRSFFRLFYN